MSCLCKDLTACPEQRGTIVYEFSPKSIIFVKLLVYSPVNKHFNKTPSFFLMN